MKRYYTFHHFLRFGLGLTAVFILTVLQDNTFAQNGGSELVKSRHLKSHKSSSSESFLRRSYNYGFVNGARRDGSFAGNFASGSPNSQSHDLVSSAEEKIYTGDAKDYSDGISQPYVAPLLDIDPIPVDVQPAPIDAEPITVNAEPIPSGDPIFEETPDLTSLNLGSVDDLPLEPTVEPVVIPGGIMSTLILALQKPYEDKIVLAQTFLPAGVPYEWRLNGVPVESGTTSTTFLAHFDGNLNTADGECEVAAENINFEPGKFGTGMSGKAQYAVNDNLDFDEGTVELWLTLRQPLTSSVYDANTGDPYIFRYRNPVTGELFMMNIKTAEGILLFTVHKGFVDPTWGGAVQINTMHNNVPINKPMLLSMTYSKTENKSSLYLNGFKISQNHFNDFNFAPANGNLVIGNANAVVDEFRILNKALSSEEIRENYIRGVPFSPNDLYYAGPKSAGDVLEVAVTRNARVFEDGALVQRPKINVTRPDGYVIANTDSIELSFTTESSMHCAYGSEADVYAHLPRKVRTSDGFTHTIQQPVGSTIPSYDFYIKCRASDNGDDYAWYRRLRVLPPVNNNYPKLALYFTGNVIAPTEASDIARYDYVLPSNNNLNRSLVLRQIREANPNILLVMYQYALSNTLYGVSDIASADLAEQLQDSWRLHNVAGEYAINLYYPNQLNYNLNPAVPFSEALTDHLEKNAIAKGDWDGIGYDGPDTTFWFLYDYAHHTFTQPMDYDLDGVDEDLNDSGVFAEVRSLWGNGLQRLMELTRAKLGQDVLVVGNNADMHHGLYNGKMWESMLHRNGVWNLDTFLNPSNDNSFLYWQMHSKTPHMNWNIFLTNQANYRYSRYGLVASLLGGVYHMPTPTDGAIGYRHMLWYDEFWVDWQAGVPTTNGSIGRGYLGDPVGEPYQVQPNIWRRDFQHGIVILNNNYYGTPPATIDLGQEFRLINGVQDHVANSGATIQNLILPAVDARVLLTTVNNDPLPSR
ncbi:MAG TPA: putative glycoside hydrolase [Candidatus Omnitrophota bacterium]|nr:putative glycoside hydrolase [Candidatus Omnitrophota bacterium]HPD84715.1 putative glycoside hydrolase [Candidatus Omnitrophota bacterium]HRZ03573.1 putative glycoside hydrolase [Candidatus Omnitrophota bacterium]